MGIQNYSMRDKLERRLLSKYSGLLWSYNKRKVNSLSDELIIEKLLINGGKRDWIDLKQAYNKALIRKVWKDQLLMSGFFPEKQRRSLGSFLKAKIRLVISLIIREEKLHILIERSF